MMATIGGGLLGLAAGLLILLAVYALDRLHRRRARRDAHRRAADLLRRFP